MRTVASFVGESAIGFTARRLRLARKLTRQELAAMAGVSRREVDLFEHNLPVALDVRRRLLKELWARHAKIAVPA